MDNTVLNPTKKICLISKEIKNPDTGKIVQEKGNVIRVSRSVAMHLVESGAYTPTTKSKLKSFLNKEGKLHRNIKAAKAFGTEGGSQNLGDKLFTRVATFKLFHRFMNFNKFRNRHYKKDVMNNYTRDEDGNLKQKEVIASQTGSKLVIIGYKNH